MIRNGQDYRESIRDGREVFINGEKVKDVTQHPMFKPLGYQLTFGQIKPEIKNRISHRSLAFKSLINFLSTNNS